MSRTVGAETRARLLTAAAELFAARGFHGTKVRDVAARARVNLAAGHYHFGSKRALYLEVLRAQFADIQAELARRGATRSPAEIARLSRTELVDLLRSRTKVMLDLLIGPPPRLHATLMQREMCDPSAALPVIVKEFIAPMVGEINEIVTRLAPDLTHRDVERCTFSIFGQTFFYRFTMPATLKLWGLRCYPQGLAGQLAAHITEFSLAGVTHLATRRGGRGHAG